MAELNYLCKHDISDKDCKKCGKLGIIFYCPGNCPYFYDVRKDMTKEMIEERDRLMKKLGTKDKLPWEE